MTTSPWDLTGRSMAGVRVLHKVGHDGYCPVYRCECACGSPIECRAHNLRRRENRGGVVSCAPCASKRRQERNNASRRAKEQRANAEIRGVKKLEHRVISRSLAEPPKPPRQKVEICPHCANLSERRPRNRLCVCGRPWALERIAS